MAMAEYKTQRFSTGGVAPGEGSTGGFQTRPYMRIGLFVCLLFVLTTPAHAQQNPNPERTESFVYATTHYDGAGYGSSVVVPEVDTMYLLANVDNVVAPRKTLIYYWSLTNEYLADWNRQNELVEGTLEVLQNGAVIDEIALTEFVIQYDSQDILGTVELISGDAAQQAFTNFEAAQEAYREALFAHARAEQAYRDALREITQNNEPGTVDPADLPVRPEPPDPLTFFSTDLISGYVLNLPVGTYRLRTRLPSGEVQPGSEKTLVVYEARRDGVAYEVTPKSRWTRPEIARSPQATIYAEPGTTVYLRPYSASEYNQLYYNRMNNPQAINARPDRTQWVQHQPLAQASARVQVGDAVRTVEITPFYVRQIATDARGYDIIEWDSSVSEQPSFDGFRVDVPADGAAFIWLVDENGAVIENSLREIRPLYANRTWLPYVLSALPLLVGGVVVGGRRRQTRRVRAGEATA